MNLMQSFESFRKLAFGTASDIVGAGNAGEIVSEVEVFARSTGGELEQNLVIAKTREFANRRLLDARALAFQRACHIVEKSDAEDIAQEVIIKYIRQPEIESWKAWILDVAKKDAINKWKSWHNRLGHFDGEDESVIQSKELPAQADKRILDEESKKEISFLIQKTLKWLKEKDDEWYLVFCMTRFGKKSRKEIKDALSKPTENSVKGIQQRATEAFRTQWHVYKKELE
jgi:DNA-directed RNA polymerase specialized sigma24 family protein